MGEGGVRLSVAFVSQAIDVVLEPGCSPVGRVTAGLAAGMAEVADVTVFASAAPAGNRAAGAGRLVGGVRHRFIPLAAADTLARRAWPHVAALAGRRLPPESCSTLPSLGYLRRLLPELAAAAADVIHVQHATPFLPAIRRACPDALLAVHLHARLPVSRGLRRMYDRLSRADLVLCVSDYLTDTTAALFPGVADRCRTVRNGMDPAVFQPRPARLRPRQDRRVMLYVGAVSPHKGVHDVVDTFIELAAARPDLQLHVVGPPGVYPLEEIYAPGDPRATALAPYYQGDYAAMLRRRIPPALAGRVLWLGGQTSEQVAARMADADVVCCASVCDEGFLLPAVEAAGTGTPVVATRVGAVPEVVLDGVTGLLVPPCDPAALADATARVLDDRSLANRLGAAAAARAHKQFTWPRQAETLWRHYTSPPAGQAVARG